MGIDWTGESLARRIDRCYRIAAWTRLETKRDKYIALARHYRAVLAAMPLGSLRLQTARPKAAS